MHAPASTAAAAAPSTPVQWKQELAAQRGWLKTDFLEHPSPGELLRRLHSVVDRRLRDMWKSFAMPRDVALLAVGGYGRGELFPYSDVDLLILLPQRANEALERKLEQLVSALWDIG